MGKLHDLELRLNKLDKRLSVVEKPIISDIEYLPNSKKNLN